MKNEHPHRFFKPFNGIDAVGRFILLCALTMLAFTFGTLLERSDILQRSGLIPQPPYHNFMLMLPIILGIILFLSIGLGLCLRKRLAYLALRILLLFGIVAGGFLSIYAIYTAIESIGSAIAEEMKLFAVIAECSVVIIVSTSFYFVNPGVRKEFYRECFSEDEYSRHSRPSWPFLLSLFSVGITLFLVGIILWSEVKIYFSQYSFSSNPLIVSLLVMPLYTGIFLSVTAILLRYKIRFGCTFGRWLGYCNMVFPVGSLVLFGIEIIYEHSFAGFLYLLLCVPAAYPAWSMLRYLESIRGQSSKITGREDSSST